MRRIAWTTIAVLLVVLLALPVSAQRPEDRQSRWESLSDSEKAKVLERFQQWRSLSDEERRRTVENTEKIESRGEQFERNARQWNEFGPAQREYLRTIQQRKEQLFLCLDPDERAHIENLPPEEKRRELQGRLQQNMLGEMLERIPGDVRERIEAAPENQRFHLARRYLKSLMDRGRRELMRGFSSLPQDQQNWLRGVVNGDDEALRDEIMAAQMLMQNLPEDVRSELESMTPGERLVVLERHIIEHRFGDHPPHRFRHGQDFGPGRNPFRGGGPPPWAGGRRGGNGGDCPPPERRPEDQRGERPDRPDHPRGGGQERPPRHDPPHGQGRPPQREE